MSEPARIVASHRPLRNATADRGVRRSAARASLVRRTLVAADILALVFAFAVVFVIFGSRSTSTNELTSMAEIGFFAATLPCWVLLAKLYGLYDSDDRHPGHSTVDDVLPIVSLITVGSWLFYLGASISGFAQPYAPKMFTFWALAVVGVIAARVAARAFYRRRPAYLQNLVVVGAGDVGRLLARKLEDHPEYGVRLVGFVETSEDVHRKASKVLGPVSDLEEIVLAHEVEHVLIAYPNASRAETAETVRHLQDLQVHVDIVPRFVDLVTPGATITMLEGLPLISLASSREDRLLRGMKRLIDVVGAALGLILLAPAFAWIALRVKLDSPGPVLYRHRRVGLAGREFDLIKFRTMRADADTFEELLAHPTRRAEFARTHKLVDDPRVTRFGSTLRRLSLDELPQLVNVLLGDMSLVGPRPVTKDELSRYGDESRTLLTFRPGVTGYWQINGRSRADYDERVRLDIAYVRGWSLKLDFLILGKTAWVVLSGHGAY
jgi:exopolysaccharide biosynthesis polyprenyl glycosylphosphotransferase